MDDLEALANLTLVVWLLPMGAVAGLALASLHRALRAEGESRIYAVLAAICLGAFVVSAVTFPVGFVPLAVLALLGLGGWAASLLSARPHLLLADAALVPLSIAVVVLVL